MPNVSDKVLCIEDDGETAAMIAEELADRGFEVEIARSGEEGLLTIIRQTPDLVLCDIRMPSMSGYEVLERLKEFAPRIGRIPFIFLTGLIEREDELKGRRLGADDYVTKPIDFDRLFFIIKSRLAGATKPRPVPEAQNLNHREIEVLTEVARGKKSREIARQLHLSRRAIDFHVGNARNKLRAETRSEAVIKAVAVGLIKP
jgi:DNA-binding NarL/FixJ family response regulator